MEAEGEDSNDHLPPIDQHRGGNKKSRKLNDYVSDHSDSEFDSLNKGNRKASKSKNVEKPKNGKASVQPKGKKSSGKNATAGTKSKGINDLSVIYSNGDENESRERQKKEAKKINKKAVKK
jgi:hypothetical protein